MTEIYIIGTVITMIVGALVWHLKSQTKHQNKRDDRREVRDAKREDRLVNIVDETLKTNTESTKTLTSVIKNDLVHVLGDLKEEIKKKT